MGFVKLASLYETFGDAVIMETTRANVLSGNGWAVCTPQSKTLLLDILNLLDPSTTTYVP